MPGLPQRGQGDLPVQLRRRQQQRHQRRGRSDPGDHFLHLITVL